MTSISTLQSKLYFSIQNAKKISKRSSNKNEKRNAWEEVEELSSALSHKKIKKLYKAQDICISNSEKMYYHNSEEFCKVNPTYYECLNFDNYCYNNPNAKECVNLETFCKQFPNAEECKIFDL